MRRLNPEIDLFSSRLDLWLLFLSKYYIKIRNTCNVAIMQKSWNEFNFFQDGILKQKKDRNRNNRNWNFNKRAL